jgi:SpoIID/LytB domain protein
MPIRSLALALAVVAALLGPAGATPRSSSDAITVTTFVVNGRGWGHGVGLAQWGAYGYAKHGVTYDKILAHYYPGTKRAPAPVYKVKVLLIESAGRVVVSSPDSFRVQDATGVVHDLVGGNYPLDSSLTLQVDPVKGPEALPGPLTFLPGKSPLWLAHPFRGTFRVTATGKTLSVVNTVALESYIRGVVSNEMPRDWPLEAVKAQAVAARSYALAHLRGGAFDVYADTRDQVYGGIATETPVGDQAVAGTKRQVLLYRGKIATTFFFSSSGGRTAAVTDVFQTAKPTPYLVSVPDPYDTFSPYHTWGPVTISAATAARLLQVPGLTDLRPVPATGRARSIVVAGPNGDVTVAGGVARRALALRSAWIKVGLLSLSRPAGTVAAGTSVTLAGRAVRVAGVALEQRPSGGGWQAGPALSVQPDGSFSLAVALAATMQFRLSAGAVKSAVLNVPVAPS